MNFQFKIEEGISVECQSLGFYSPYFIVNKFECAWQGGGCEPYAMGLKVNKFEHVWGLRPLTGETHGPVQRGTPCPLPTPQNRMTDVTENFIFPQLRWRRFVQSSIGHSPCNK